MRKKQFGLVAMAMALAVGVVVGACGDDDEPSGTGATNNAALTGAPIEIGLVSTENSPAGSYNDVREGEEAAIRYINAELGGVNGRPIRSELCVTDATPETSILCANKFVQSNKIAVIPGIDLGAPAAIPIYADVGIPYVGGLPVSFEEYKAPTGYSFTGGGFSLVAGTATYIGQEIQAKKVAVLATAVPQTQEVFDGYFKPVLAALGVTDVTLVTESPTAPDFTPAVTRANDGDPDAIAVFFGGQACTKAMQAVQLLGIPKDKVVYGSQCASKDLINASGGGGDGSIYQATLQNIDGDSPNAAIFRDRMAKSSDITPDLSSAAGFDSIMNLYRVLKEIDPSKITAEALTTALQATSDKPAFLSEGFTCNRSVFPPLPALCDTNARFFKYEGGEYSETTNRWIDAAEFAPR